ncbi:TPM domain-containing protein [Spongiibacter taiwanensis]|uniref:TPM domain-containing protein n=1 Tax=Spongiibacter taiwanensis TaxID=1748242 RepID=UPI0020355FCF|nr:TPM domain-containing protein [Spongiibacter taiwanensis]USA41847.1 TPM domain-containing protein [Spongiibacter taiwanensis]
MTSPRRALLPLLALLLFFAASAHAAPDFPKLSGRVVDNADMLSIATEREVSKKLAAHEQATGNQVAVVTLKDLQGETIEDYGYQLGRHWGIGQKDKDNGALLIVAKQEREIRIEVGYGLEGQLTDAVSAQIIFQIISPAFRQGQFDTGIRQGVDAMLEVLGGGKLAPSKASKPKQAPPALGGLILLFVILMMIGGGRGGRGFLGGMVLGSVLGGGHRGGFGGGGFGGGFGGGGGGFGGGGASGGW